MRNSRRYSGAKFRKLALPGACVAIALSLAMFAARADDPINVMIEDQESGTKETLIAISAVTRNVAWAGGTHGSYTFTTNGGKTWTAGKVADAESLDFRDVQAVSATTAYLFTSGPGKQSRIYITDDAGAHWQLRFTNIDPALQWKGFAMWNPLAGVSVSDAVLGEFTTMHTTDGGWHWNRVSWKNLPQAFPAERSEMSSGTNLVVGRSGRAWFGTTRRRVLRTKDYGITWKASFAHVTNQDSLGVVALAFRDKDRGMAFAASARTPDDTMIAITTNGGDDWDTPRALQPLMTQISGAAYVPELGGPTVMVVGPQGVTISKNNGRSWERLTPKPFNAIAFGGRSGGWAVGSGGRITKFSF